MGKILIDLTVDLTFSQFSSTGVSVLLGKQSNVFTHHGVDKREGKMHYECAILLFQEGI